MEISDWINVILCILSFALAAISVVIVVITLRQNKEMIENATRPYVSAKYETITTPTGTSKYVVIKNYGQTAAQILEANCSGNAHQDYLNRVNMLSGTSLAPNQRVIYYFGEAHPGPPKEVTVFCRYKGLGKRVYEEKTTLRLRSGGKFKRTKGEDTVSFALQEIAERML